MKPDIDHVVKWDMILNLFTARTWVGNAYVQGCKYYAQVSCGLYSYTVPDKVPYAETHCRFKLTAVVAPNLRGIDSDIISAKLLFKSNAFTADIRVFGLDSNASSFRTSIAASDTNTEPLLFFFEPFAYSSVRQNDTTIIVANYVRHNKDPNNPCAGYQS